MDLAHDIARTILDGFARHYYLFRETSARAKQRFEQADWAAVRAATRVRIEMYDHRVHEAVAAIRERFPTAHRDDALWPQIKLAYIALLYDHQQPECAETFYNSVACRVLDRAYYRNDYIFWRPAVSTEFIVDEALPTYRCYYPATQGLRRMLFAIARSFDLAVPFEDLRRDVRCVLGALRVELPGPNEWQPNLQVQVLSSLFFRNEAAYVVGRIVNGNTEQPFAVPVRHRPGGGGLYLDALLLRREHLGTLFSLGRAYFMVEMAVPAAHVTFLQKCVPSRSRAELYTMLGLQKQGKTLFYRDLHDHLSHSSDAFVVAPGARGLVMLVFTLPSFPFVFKVIRDSFEPPKTATRAEVMGKYLLVKYHDRVGRMADTLEYSDVAFPLARVGSALLAELDSSCRTSLERDGENLVIRHLYIERRMTPFDVWLRSAEPAQALRGVDELGRAIRELAEANIFPGDLFLKNFGMTRWGRLVFYDYDEISYLTEMNFRRMPPPRDHADEVASEPWFSVGPNDVFPEEFLPFLLPPGPLRERFVERHGELLDAEWWRARQIAIRTGAQHDVIPYAEETRFRTRPTGHGDGS